MTRHAHPGPFGSQTSNCNCPNPDLATPSWADPGHTHKAPDGTLVKCYHDCKNQLRTPAFWVLTTLAFPIEHAIWTKLPYLKELAVWAGL